MKNRSPWFLLCILLSLISCVKEPQPVKVTGITLNNSSITLTEGETAVLIATISPKDADNQTVLWSSSNGNVASVSNGAVTANAAGTATITAKSDDGGYTASCVVTVVSRTIEVTSISLSKTELSLVEGDTEILSATVKPDNATDKTVTWSSSASDVATVDNGKVTALKEGTATITAKAGEKSATCKVTVKKKVIPVESVTLDKSDISLVEGDTETLTATVKPDNATDKTVTWTSSAPDIASVNNGKVTALKEGTATITAKAGDKTATCKVTVVKKVIHVESITLNKTQITLKTNATEVLIATVNPDNATDKGVTWKSNNTTVATVDQSGKVTAIKEGTAIITVTTKDGSKKATCEVTVLSPGNTEPINDSGEEHGWD